MMSAKGWLIVQKRLPTSSEKKKTFKRVKFYWLEKKENLGPPSSPGSLNYPHYHDYRFARKVKKRGFINFILSPPHLIFFFTWLITKGT